MTNVTHILSQIESGDPSAAEQLLPLVYQELRILAAAKLTHEKSGQTLQATALVHEAYLRLVDGDRVQAWESRGHFFAAAAEAMRRILVDRARWKASRKHGGDRDRIDLLEISELPDGRQIDLLALDDALTELEQLRPENARIIKLRFFAGLTLEDAARVMGVSRATAQRKWTYARAWLFGRLQN